MTHAVSARRGNLRGLGILLFMLAVASLRGAPLPALAPEKIPAYFPPQYYFNIDLDNRYQFEGLGQMTEADAASADCYRFVYSSKGRLQQIEYRRAGTPLPDPLLQVARINFEYGPGTERRTFFDAQDKPASDSDGIAGEDLTLNAAGYPTDIMNLDESGGHMRDVNGVLHYVRTLDEHSRLIQSRRIGLFGNAITDKSGEFEKRTTYDVDGRVMEVANFDGQGNPLNNDDGVALIRTTYTIYPDSTQTIESYFDASGLAVEEKSTGVHQRQRTVDKRGFLLDEAYFDATGAPTSNNDDRVHERRFTYDEKGNLLTEEYVDGNGHLVSRRGPEIARITYKYDQKNRVVERAFFGDDGTAQIPPDVGAAKIRQEYDAQGNVVRRLFLDGQGHPTPHALFGAPGIRIKVEGDTTIVTLRNENDRPMKDPVHGYYALSYKAGDRPLTRTNLYFDRHGRLMTLLRVFVINPHLAALAGEPVMKWSARLGAGAALVGSLLAGWLALKKSRFTRRRQVYVPTPLERFLGWLAVLAILEGMLRFFITIYWWFVIHANGQMSGAIYAVEALFLLFMLYRLTRLRRTMRVLNIERDDVHRLVREFFLKAGLNAEWMDGRKRYVTSPLDVRLNYFLGKFHAYLAFNSRGEKGRALAAEAAAFIRAQAGGIRAPERTGALALYYPLVAFGYLLVAGTAAYTLFQLIKGF